MSKYSQERKNDELQEHKGCIARINREKIS